MKKYAKAIIITGFGLNCERETAAGFEVAGGSSSLVHLNELIKNPDQLSDYHILCFIGGFSFGDHLGAGTVLANRLKHQLGTQLRQFIEQGKLVIGICNGFQTIARMGLVPALNGIDFAPSIALAENDSGVFRDSWVALRCNPNSPCIFTEGIDIIPLPIRHGEGKVIPRSKKVLEQMEEKNQVVMQYVDIESMEPTMQHPQNPNGSVNAIAGICDKTGRVFGLMPHPEAYLSPYNHPHWLRQKINGILETKGMGQLIFRNAVSFVEYNLLS